MPHRRAVRTRAAMGLVALVVALAVVSLVVPAGAAAAQGKVVWLCRPGQEHNPCQHSLRTTLISPSGQRLGGKHPLRPRHRKMGSPDRRHWTLCPLGEQSPR